MRGFFAGPSDYPSPRGGRYQEHQLDRRGGQTNESPRSRTTWSLEPFPRITTGLQNLGNTCYMNSAMQSLAHSPPFVRMILSDAVMRAGGNQRRFTQIMQRLLIAMIDKGETSSEISAVKYFMAEVSPHLFAGYSQRDASTLLRTAIQQLHKELNPVVSKPYILPVTCTSDDPAELHAVAHQAWQDFRLRESGPIVDTMYFQRKVSQRCTQCHHTVHTFDSLSMLMLPIPDPAKAARLESEHIDRMRQQQAHQTSQETLAIPEETPLNVQVVVQLLAEFGGGVFHHLELKLTPTMNMHTVLTLILEALVHRQLVTNIETDVYHFHFSALESQSPSKSKVSFLSLVNSVSVSTTDSNMKTLADVLDSAPDFNSRVLVASQLSCAASTALPQSIDDTSGDAQARYVDVSFAVLGTDQRIRPINCSIPIRFALGSDFTPTAIEVEVQRCLKILLPWIEEDDSKEQRARCITVSVQFLTDSWQLAAEDVVTGRVIAVIDPTQSEYDIEDDRRHFQNVSTCMHQEALPPSDNGEEAAEIQFVSVELIMQKAQSEAVTTTTINTSTKSVHSSTTSATESSTSRKDNRSARGWLPGRYSPVTLQQCYAAYAAPQPLQGTKACDNCGRTHCIETHYELWQAPHLLVICLVRFEQVYGNELRKITHPCDFPTRGLRIDTLTGSAIRGYQAGDDCGVYDLYAVTEHMGTCHGGHYIARCRVGEDQWCYFSDSHVSRSSESEVDPEGAFMLFYVRREE